MAKDWHKTDTRLLNFEVIDELIDNGFFEPKALLEELIRSLDSWQVNDHLAYITRMWGIELSMQEELEHYEKDSLDT
jgi:hypothetical protein